MRMRWKSDMGMKRKSIQRINDNIDACVISGWT